MPLLFNTPTLTIIAPTILDMGTEAQKRRHLPAMIRGDELWVQFMSEPSGGSDLAGVITSAVFDGANYVLNGSKIWSSYAYFSDYAICLARTDWDAVKHRGLTMFTMKIHQPGITVNRIRQSDGNVEFCQEFFDDLAVAPEQVLGKVNDGWSVAQRLLFHERSATGGSSPYASGTAGRRRENIDDLVRLARAAAVRMIPIYAICSLRCTCCRPCRGRRPTVWWRESPPRRCLPPPGRCCACSPGSTGCAAAT